MENKTLLLMISHSTLGDNIENAFIQANFNVYRTMSYTELTDMLKNKVPQAIIVDWDLADHDVENLKRLVKSQYKRTAFILLSKNRALEERIHALEEGVDECIASIPQLEELVAKVNALVRRIHMVEDTQRCMQIKDIEINLDTHEVRKAGKLIDLTYTQFKLLYLLASKRDYIFTRNEILEKVWGEHAFVTDRTVDVHVKRLREKLGENRLPSRYIQTIHGLGYRFA
ncbi:response regulator transcription factor [bacterium]|nr:response regulator transcription factor [candidate division CSSED10-310 bacterium]